MSEQSIPTHKDNWTDDELSNLDLGDQRLNDRVRKTVNSFAMKPDKSVLQACGDINGAKAVYRLCDNAKVSAEGILAPHLAASVERIKKLETVLVVQDTTVLDFSNRKKPIEGMGFLTHDYSHGCLLHPSVAFSTEGLCLGLVHQMAWARDGLVADCPHPNEKEKAKEKAKARPIEEKESKRWIEGYRAVDKLAKEHENTLFICLQDREGDFFEFLHERTPESRAHILTRAKTDRNLSGEPFNDEEGKKEHEKLWGRVKKESPVAFINFAMPSINRGKKKRKARSVSQAIRFSRVVLPVPWRLKKVQGLAPVELTAIYCSEINVPAGEEPIEWMLLTSLIPDNNLSVAEIVRYYTLRWQIEVFFKVLKSGCTIEKLQFETLQRTMNCIALYLIVAWRILYLTMIGRFYPDLPCNAFYEEEEWKAMYVAHFRKKPPQSPFCIRQANLIVAMLGGFPGRKGDGHPGIKSMWQGLTRLYDLSYMYSLTSLNPL